MGFVLVFLQTLKRRQSHQAEKSPKYRHSKKALEFSGTHKILKKKDLVFIQISDCKKGQRVLATCFLPQSSLLCSRAKQEPRRRQICAWEQYQLLRKKQSCKVCCSILVAR